MRALRRPQSQGTFNRRLGYKSNVASQWESGRRAPLTTELLRIAELLEVDLQAGLADFLGESPAFLTELAPSSPEGIAAFMQHLRRGRSHVELAERMGVSRSALTRWVRGSSIPRVPEFLLFVEVTTHRLVDWLAILVDPVRLPSIKQLWEALEARRRIMADLPWSHAVLRVFETEGYRGLLRHEPGFVARRLGLSLEEETALIDELMLSELIRWTGTHYETEPTMTDFWGIPEAVVRRRKAHWAKIGLERLEARRRGLFSTNLFSVSAADYERIREAHIRYFEEVRSIVATSEPAEKVAVINVQLFELDHEDAG